MTTRYVWSGATGAGTGADWTNAYTTLAAALAADAAGDVVLVAHDHSETASSSNSVTYTFDGVRTNPEHIVCVDRTTGLPASTALIKTTGSYNIVLTGSGSAAGTVIDGIKFRVAEGGSGNNTLQLQLQRWMKNCTIEAESTFGGGIVFGPYGHYELTDTWLKGVSANAGFGSSGAAATRILWNGGGVLPGSAMTALVYVNYDVQIIKLCNLDLSALPATANLFYIESNVGVDLCVRDTRLPVGWSGAITTGVPGLGSRASLYNCDAGDTNYNLWIADHSGTIVDETSIYRTDGAKVRNQANTEIGYAWKCTTNTNTNEWLIPLKTDPLLRFFPGTAGEQSGWSAGAPKTVTVEIAHSATAALTDAQAWLEVEYLNTDAYPQGDIVSTQRANVTVTPTAAATSSAAWSGTAQTYRQKLTATIAPQAPGIISVRVCLATGNGVIVYVDPTITVN